MSIILFHLENWLFLNEILIKRLRHLVCENIWSGKGSINRVTGCLRNLLEWNKFLWQWDIWEYYSSGTNSPKKRPVVLENYSLGSICLDKDTCCLRNFFYLVHFVPDCQSKRLPYQEKNWFLCRICSAEAKSFRFMEFSTFVLVVAEWTIESF